jgi:hypothetical protein
MKSPPTAALESSLNCLGKWKSRLCSSNHFDEEDQFNEQLNALAMGAINEEALHAAYV